MKSKVNVKLLAIGFILSVVIVSVLIVIYSAITYPLSRRSIYREMEAKHILSVSEDGGVLIFVAATEESYTAYLYTRNIFINRYRLHGQSIYDEPLITAVPGSRSFFLVLLVGESVQFFEGEHRPIQLHQIAGLAIALVIVTALIYHGVNSYKEEEEEGEAREEGEEREE